MLEAASHDLEVADWLLWFPATVIEAQRRSPAQIDFIIGKARLLERVRGKRNARQEKAVLRMFAAGPDGFTEGLSAGIYRGITGAAPATATRDLADLVTLDLLQFVARMERQRNPGTPSAAPWIPLRCLQATACRGVASRCYASRLISPLLPLEEIAAAQRCWSATAAAAEPGAGS